MHPRIVALFGLSLALFGCGSVSAGPCYWDFQQDRETGRVAATSLACDGVATDPAVLSVRYQAGPSPLIVNIDAIKFTSQLSFDASMPDGTYSVAAPVNLEADKGKVIATGAKTTTGTFTFTRSRDVPFVDIAAPDVKTYTSTIDVTFDLVAELPPPDPSMGTGCKLTTGEQHVALTVSGPVVDCKRGLATGH